MQNMETEGIGLPKEFMRRMEEQLGTEEWVKLFAALQERPQTGVRINPRKETFLQGSLAEEMGGIRVEWNSNGYRLKNRPDFALDPAWHQGLYYVQEPSSMAVAQAIDYILDREGEQGAGTVVDLCAAPGGKSSAALDRLPSSTLLVANEYDRRRASILYENMVKWGIPEVIVTHGDTVPLCHALEGAADIVIADVPCSGEGMMRREPMAREQWSLGLVESCAALQRHIAAEGVRALRPGGWMIYSTCTFNREENEENIAWLASELNMEVHEGVLPYEGHFYPHERQGEGLFLRLLRKPEEITGSRRHKGLGRAKNRPLKSLKDTDIPWVDARNTELTAMGDEVWALSDRYLRTAQSLAAVTKVIAPGTRVAIRGKRGWEPTHEAAMSLLLKRGVFAELELSRTDALRYLARRTDVGATTAGATPSSGYMLATYRGAPLGWLKKVGNRYNNLYPAQWRIRKPLPDK